MKAKLGLLLFIASMAFVIRSVPIIASPNYAQLLESSPKVHVTDGSGSCVCIRVDGQKSYFLTCEHVVKELKSKKDLFLTFGLDNADHFAAEVGKTSEESDLAVISVTNGPSVHAVPLSLNFPSLGEPLFSPGAPYGIPELVIYGFLSCPDPVNVDDRQVMVLDMAIRPGNSGGPVCNSYGQVVGIAEAVIPSSNIAIAITSSCCKKFLNW